MDPQRTTGLTSEEAADRLERAGPNEIATGGGRGVWAILRETMREPMFLLLVGAAILYLVLGELGEGLFLALGASATIGLVIFQEARSERALAALREIAQPLARVLRDGREAQIPAREIVPGDILLIGEGERLPADGVLLGGDVLSVDESALTGESAPISKTPLRHGENAQAQPTPGTETGPFVFSGTLVARGQGVIQVTQTGVQSALGRIGQSLAAIEQEPTPLQRTAGRLVAILGLTALAFCGLVAVVYGVMRGDWVEGVLAGVTVAIALIPEEFPMVLAVFLALGAWRLATHRVLVRRSAVIETLGAATVLCVDKTGTLTENRAQVARLWTAGGDTPVEPGHALTGPAAELVRVAALASAVRPADPMDKAVRDLDQDLRPNGLGEAGEPARAWPLRAELLAVVQLWRKPDGAFTVAAKGAPEAVFRLCRLSAPEIEGLQTVIQSYAEQGLRVLGVATASGAGAFPDEPQAIAFTFAGLVGFMDPMRDDVPAALREARGAGVKVIMITGDHPVTALAIARLAGIETQAGVIAGADLDALSKEALRDRLAEVRVFARIIPEQKLRIVEALKSAGEIVAMTGDGVNDAPALEAAHIGVAMGRNGTDVAREAADLVLLDNTFASIVGGVRLGRRIFTNLRRALTYITAVHVPIAGLALAPILLGFPPMLLPMHVVLLELVIDPTCSLVFEAEPSDKEVMRRPPRRPDEPLFGKRQIGLAMAQGLGVLAGVLGLYAWLLTVAATDDLEARGAAYVALVVGVLVLALTDSARTGRLFAPSRRIFWAIATAIAGVLTAILAIPALASIFDVTRPTPEHLLLAIGVGALGGGWTGVTGLVRSRMRTGPACY